MGVSEVNQYLAVLVAVLTMINFIIIRPVRWLLAEVKSMRQEIADIRKDYALKAAVERDLAQQQAHTERTLSRIEEQLDLIIRLQMEGSNGRNKG